MRFYEKIVELRKQEKIMEEHIRLLSNNLDHRWTFCLHTHYDDAPRISAWLRGEDVDSRASFAIKYGNIELIDAGKYWADWREAEEILDTWLKQEI